MSSAKKKEKGQSLTELAVSFTLLMLMLSVAVDGGRLFFSYIAVREAAEEGALHAAFYPGDESGITARVRSSSTTPVDLTNTDKVKVERKVFGSACAGNTVAVAVAYDFNLTMPFIGAFLGSQQFPLTATSTAKIVSPGC